MKKYADFRLYAPFNDKVGLLTKPNRAIQAPK